MKVDGSGGHFYHTRCHLIEAYTTVILFLPSVCHTGILCQTVNVMSSTCSTGILYERRVADRQRPHADSSKFIVHIGSMITTRFLPIRIMPTETGSVLNSSLRHVITQYA